MNISKRLKSLAAFIEHDAIVYDVGCDHALLSCFLVKEKIAKKVYAGDNKEGPLLKAKENIEAYGLSDFVIPILGDGLKKAPADVDTVIIAGMGFNTTEAILDAADLSRFKKVIVQINKDVDKLRQYISDRGYTIIDELVVADGFYYEIVVFESAPHPKYSALEIKYGPILLKNRDKVFIDYLEYKKNKLEAILAKHEDEKLKATLKEIETIISG